MRIVSSKANALSASVPSDNIRRLCDQTFMSRPRSLLARRTKAKITLGHG